MEESVIQHLKEQGGSLKLKKLRKLCTQDDLTSSEAHHKALLDFRHVHLDLVKAGVVSEDTNQLVTLVTDGDLTEFVRSERDEEALEKAEKSEKKREKKEEKDKKGKKRSSTDEDEADEKSTRARKTDKYDLAKNGEQAWRENSLPADYLERNPDEITRLFCGNLKLDVTEEALKEYLPGITYIRWQKDKITKAFYGSTFLEMKNPRAASLAVAKDRTKFLGRPLKIYYCPPRDGVQWPPAPEHDYSNFNNHVSSGGGGGGGSGAIGAAVDPKTMGRGYSQRPKTPRPPGCKKLYVGNLSYSIDDDTIVDFFKDAGEMVGLRWLTQKDSGDFRGCGFVEFSKPEEAEKAMELDGHELLGRPIRLDWTL